MSLAILRSTADPRRLNRVLLRMGTVTWVKYTDFAEGESEADRYFEQAYQVARTARYQFGMWEARYWLANKA